jgi:hypothetical protein
MAAIDPKIALAKKQAKVDALKVIAEEMEEDRKDAILQRAIIDKKREIHEAAVAEAEQVKEAQIAAAKVAEAQRIELEAKKRQHEIMIQQRKMIEKQEATVSTANLENG